MTPRKTSSSSVPTTEMRIEVRQPRRFEKKNIYLSNRWTAPAVTAPSPTTAPQGIGRQQPLTCTCPRPRGRRATYGDRP